MIDIKDIPKILGDRKRMTSLGKTKAVVAWVREHTSFLPDSAPLRIRLVALRDNMSSLPGCDVCGEPVTWNKSTSDEFLKYCSHRCSLKRDMIPSHALSFLRDREWLFNERIIQKKSKERIAQDLGVSVTPVDGWLRAHDIPDIRLNESCSLTRSYLRNRDWLYEQHVIQRKTLHTIAEEIGSSDATLSVWMKRHGIVTNEPNSYPRVARPSRACLEIHDFIVGLGYHPELDNRTILGGRELDIVIPSRRFAIEFNGLYSHIHRPWESTESRRKGPEYHRAKTDKCEELGYQLLHVWEDDWTEKSDIIRSMIRAKLGHSTKIHARDCDVADILDVSRRARFLDENHIQGRAPCQIAISLVLRGEIVAMMTFSKARFTKKADWELIRYVSRKDCTVVGGFSRLISHFRRRYPGSIVSYADMGYSQGNVYQRNGFRLDSVNPPGFWYVSPDFIRRHHRAAFMKSRISEPGDPRPEWEIMLERGWNRIWGVGTMTFILD